MMPGQNGYELTKEIKKKLKFQLFYLLQKEKLKIELKV
jgi:CheY-like chemotaxis protein